MKQQKHRPANISMPDISDEMIIISDDDEADEVDEERGGR
jgi:hypothetical protein